MQRKHKRWRKHTLTRAYTHTHQPWTNCTRFYAFKAPKHKSFELIECVLLNTWQLTFIHKKSNEERKKNTKYKTHKRLIPVYGRCICMGSNCCFLLHIRVCRLESAYQRDLNKRTEQNALNFNNELSNLLNESISIENSNWIIASGTLQKAKKTLENSSWWCHGTLDTFWKCISQSILLLNVCLVIIFTRAIIFIFFFSRNANEKILQSNAFFGNQ